MKNYLKKVFSGFVLLAMAASCLTNACAQE
jgi:hypothetical protein